MALLDIKNLTLELSTPKGRVNALDCINLTINAGEICGIFGESASGRSLLAKSIIGQYGSDWKVKADKMMLDDQDLLAMSKKERQFLLGNEIAIIFQDPSRCFDPAQKIGVQVLDSIPTPKVWFWQRKKVKLSLAKKWLHKVGIKDPSKIMQSYAWQLSEEECQKVMIAMALSKEPKLLIADEPTNLMEGSSQNQIYKLLVQLNKLHKISILLISHELDILADVCDNLTIIYCGQVVEAGDTKSLLENPYHHYTHAILNNIVYYDILAPKTNMPTLAGIMPSLLNLPIGCRFGPRCPNADKNCVITPKLVSYKKHQFACHYPLLEVKNGSS